MSNENNIEKPPIRLSESQINELENAFDFSTGEFDFSKISYGLKLLVTGYIDYAKEVIISRALPAIDGLKPVQRRIIHVMMLLSKGDMQKCSRIAGNVLQFHPHGDQSVYLTMVRMIDRNKTFRIPLIEGQGAFSWVYSSSKPADRRYTEARIHQNAKMIYNTALDGIDYVPSFDGSSTEPSLFSSVFPVILCNSSQGIAVGFSCNIPSFNPIDVIDLTIEKIDKGECTTVIAPDFVTGGYYIKNDKELLKLMKTGKGSMKLRARVEIDGKYISVKEIPYGATVQKLMEEINKLENPDIKNVSNYCDMNGLDLTIECASKQKAQDILLTLYKNTNLQATLSANMTIIKDEKPITLGVWGIIDEWLEVRSQQLTKHFNKQLEAIKKSAMQAKAVIDIIALPEIRDKMIDLTVHHSNKSAIEYVQSVFPDYSQELAKWLVLRDNSVLRDGGKYPAEYKSALEKMEVLEGYINDIHGYIRRELVSLREAFNGKYPRLTEITNKDFDFSKGDEIVKDESNCLYTFKDGFLKKERNYGFSTARDGELVIEATASDVLMGIDDNGRLLRVYTEHLPYSSGTDVGTFLPKYFGHDDDSMTIKALWKFDAKPKMLLYTDGFVSFLNTSEWSDTQRQVKVIERGVSINSDRVFYVGDLCDNIFVADTEGKVAWQPVKAIQVKSRTARTRVFLPSKNASIGMYACLSDVELLNFLVSPQKCFGQKLSYLDDMSELLNPSLLKTVE